MKKLLLLVSIITFTVVLTSCCNVKKTESGKAGGTNNSASKGSIVSDSIKGKQESGSAGSAGMDGGIKKDTMQSHGNGKAIIHNAPDQTKIDSIKNAKAKEKK